MTAEEAHHPHIQAPCAYPYPYPYPYPQPYSYSYSYPYPYPFPDSSSSLSSSQCRRLHLQSWLSELKHKCICCRGQHGSKMNPSGRAFTPNRIEPKWTKWKCQKICVALENVQKTVEQKKKKQEINGEEARKKASCKTVNCYAHCPLPPPLSVCVCLPARVSVCVCVVFLFYGRPYKFVGH